MLSGAKENTFKFRLPVEEANRARVGSRNLYFDVEFAIATKASCLRIVNRLRTD